MLLLFGAAMRNEGRLAPAYRMSREIPGKGAPFLVPLPGGGAAG